MPITVQTFGGRIGWAARKIAPAFASHIYTKSMLFARRKESLRYIDNFLSTTPAPKPLFVSIETINRCNGSCSFCPCNAQDESRPFKKMAEDVFLSITQQLADWNYAGGGGGETIIMNLNNEPFMDTRIIEWTRHMRMSLPHANLHLITNGTLMTLDKFIQIAPFLNSMNINNYSERMRLHHNINEVVDYVNRNIDEFKHLTIDVQYRYSKEVLSNRAGTAPNKPVNPRRKVHEPCLEPFTGMSIFPDGTVGLCCFDALEKTNMGNCSETTLEQIWNSDAFNRIRERMRRDRSEFEFCKFCDGFSKVSRTKMTRGH